MRKDFCIDVDVDDGHGNSASFYADATGGIIFAAHVCDEREFHECKISPEQVKEIYETLRKYFEGEQS